MAMRNWLLENAVARYRKGQISLERAAMDARLSLYEMMDEMRRQGIPLDQTGPEEAREEIRALLTELRA